MKFLSHWLVPATVLTICAGLIYATVQQVYRQSANDPQIQIAQDATDALTRGDSPDSVIAAHQNSDLGVYLTIYDQNYAPTYSSNKSSLTPPTGTFAYARSHIENRFTWQPDQYTRDAVVLRAYTNADKTGYVLVGRSLHQTEQREQALTNMVGLGWLVGLFILAGESVVLTLWSGKK